MNFLGKQIIKTADYNAIMLFADKIPQLAVIEEAIPFRAASGSSSSVEQSHGTLLTELWYPRYVGILNFRLNITFALYKNVRLFETLVHANANQII